MEAPQRYIYIDVFGSKRPRKIQSIKWNEFIAIMIVFYLDSVKIQQSISFEVIKQRRWAYLMYAFRIKQKH